MLREKNKHSPNLAYVGISAGILVFAAWLISYWVYSSESTTYSIIGDSFGALNTLFSGLAFVGVIYAILLQQKSLEVQQEELRLQYQELVATKKELEKSAKAQEEQANIQTKTARLQALSTMLETQENAKTRAVDYSLEWENANRETQKLKSDIEQISNSLVYCVTPAEKKRFFSAVEKMINESPLRHYHELVEMESTKFEILYGVSKQVFYINMDRIRHDDFDKEFLNDFAEYFGMDMMTAKWRILLRFAVQAAGDRFKKSGTRF